MYLTFLQSNPRDVRTRQESENACEVPHGAVEAGVACYTAFGIECSVHSNESHARTSYLLPPTFSCPSLVGSGISGLASSCRISCVHASGRRSLDLSR